MPGAHGTSTSSAKGPTGGPQAGKGAEGPRAAAEALEVTASTTASPGFYPEARRVSGSPTPGVEEGGRGAGKGRGERGHEPGASPGRAPPAGGESARGPPREAGPAGGELRARPLQRGSLPRG